MDRAALSELVQRYTKPLKRMLNKRYVDRDAAQDALQDLWLKIHRLGTSDADMQKPLSYLTKAALNMICDEATRARNVKPHIGMDEIEQLFDEANDSEVQMMDEQRRAIVRRAVDNDLTPRQRQVLIMHVNGSTYHEIAEQQSISRRQVLRELQKGYSKLRQNEEIRGLCE